MANHPLAAIRKHELRGRGQKCLELRLHRLGDQPTRAGSQNFGERIVDCPFLSKGNNSILSHGVTLLLGGSGGLITNPVTPPSSHRHPVSSIAPRCAQIVLKKPLVDESGSRWSPPEWVVATSCRQIAGRYQRLMGSRKGRWRPTRLQFRGRLIRLGEMSEDDAQSLHRGTGGSTYTRKARATREAPKRGQG